MSDRIKEYYESLGPISFFDELCTDRNISLNRLRDQIVCNGLSNDALNDIDKHINELRLLRRRIIDWMEKSIEMNPFRSV